MNGTDVFDVDANGKVITNALVGYVSAPFLDMAVLARLEYAASNDHLQAIMSGAEKPGAVQLLITPAQAKELAARLNVLADLILSQEAPNHRAKQ